jgi:hypothetical protein
MIEIICNCGNKAEYDGEGVNDTDYFVCHKCHKGYNVKTCDVDEEGNPK